MSFKLASSGSIVRKAGKNVSSISSTSGTILADLSNEVEHFVNTFCRYNFSGNASTINVNTSAALELAVSNLAAVGLIRYDMSGYTTRGEAEDMIQHLEFEANKVLTLIKEDTFRKFVIRSEEHTSEL